jgi:ECF transporter S component (folate family)
MNSHNIWKSSAEKLKNTHYLALMAAFIAMKIIVGLIRIPVAENLRVSFTFLLVAVEASILGPVAGMVSGAVTDTLSFILFPDGAYFPGYTLTAMTGQLIYALFLYDKRITVLRLGLAKALNNYLVNVLMGSLWSSMLYSKAYVVYAATSLVKNTVLLPFEIAALVVLFNLLSPLLVRHKLMKDPGKLPLKWK